MASYSPIYGTVSSVTPLQTSGDDSKCMQLISMVSQSLGQVDLVVTPQTYVLEQHTFQTGDPITAIYDTKAPVPLIYPPQFTAVILAENDDGYQVAFDYFNEDLVNENQTLKLDLSNEDNTEILLSNGQTFFYHPGGHYLFVLYMFTTRSIPAVTNPEKIIVFCTSNGRPKRNE
ncbi:hypothetical protein [Clostridium sp. Marseille-P2415]|uniref:hypothetical protein n=1 Tax=Clostridium sp. Marseille-P2415 TaxID=1805471 RepID=UPI00098842D0|nr:hypothetical protein [Clostridium sp. Marseille-P2415]